MNLHQNSPSLHDKNSEETRNKGIIPQHNKGYIWQIGHIYVQNIQNEGKCIAFLLQSNMRHS
jgi:hypothetical protein